VSFPEQLLAVDFVVLQQIRARSLDDAQAVDRVLRKLGVTESMRTMCYFYCARIEFHAHEIPGRAVKSNPDKLPRTRFTA